MGQDRRRLVVHRPVGHGVAADLKLYYDVGRALADTSDWPNWVEGDEFRAIRDKDRAGK